MKKISYIFCIFILMIACFISISFATENKPEENAENAETTENVTEEVPKVENETKSINTFGKVVENNGVKDVTIGVAVDKVQEVVVMITEGEYKGDEFVVNYILSYDVEGKMMIPELKVGNTVEVQITEGEDSNITVNIVEVSKVKPIAIILIIFLLSFLVMFGKSGIRTIISLAFTVIFIYVFTLSKIDNGSNVILIAIATVLVNAFVVNAIKSGINKKSISATLGIVCGVLLSGVITLIFVKYAKLTGPYEMATNLGINSLNMNISFKNLIFAGTLIASTGICMNVGEEIVSELEKIKMTNSEISWNELFKQGIKIGRNCLEKNSHTLILYCIGTYLSFVTFLIMSNMSLVQIINKEQIVEVIIIPIIGMVSAIYTVPITSIIYSFLNKDKLIYRRSTENKLDGKRSLKL